MNANLEYVYSMLGAFVDLIRPAFNKIVKVYLKLSPLCKWKGPCALHSANPNNTDLFSCYWVLNGRHILYLEF